MFDIGFSELVVIAIVALIVIGPERLPKVARTMGHLFGRMQRYVNDVKADISREMELDELKKMQASMEDAARSMRDSVDSVDKDVAATGDELNKLAQAVHADTNPDPLPVPAPAAETPSQQAELPLDTNPPPAQKQA